MQVWNMLRAARWKHSTQKWRKKSPSGHHPTTLSGYIFAKACIDNREKNSLSSNISSTCPHNMVNFELRPTSGWDRFVTLGHPYTFQRVSRLGSVIARQCSSGHQPNFAAMNRGRHLCLAGRPSRWALAHISSLFFFPRLISAVADWMFTILRHIMWP